MSFLPSIDEPPRSTGLGFSLTRVKIRNYKSIAFCDVELKPFTLLVGRNGSGKSNFLDALRLVQEGVFDSLPAAISRRGGFSSVARIGCEKAQGFAIELAMSWDSGVTASYGFEVVNGVGGAGIVKREFLVVRDAAGDRVEGFDLVDGRDITPNTYPLPPMPRDRLSLGNLSGDPAIREAYDALISMNFHDLNPVSMKGDAPFAQGALLAKDGANLADRFFLIQTDQPEARDRIVSYLQLVVPEIRDVRVQEFGPVKSLYFHQPISESGSLGMFAARAVSDGTLRALGVLVAVNQLASDGRPVRVVGIEEPETALHPAAAGALIDALREAATHTQVLVTTHSADLLDRYDPQEDRILAVQIRSGRTEIAPISRAGREAIEEDLFSAGELLRMDQLDPDWSDLVRQRQSCVPGKPDEQP